MATATKQSAEAVQQAVEERPSSSGRGAGGLVLHAPPNAPAADAGTHLQYLIHHTTPCLLRPLCFFVSWQGVLTLVYKGYAAPLVQLKSDLTEFYSALPPEMPGSLWPKTSLAALRDGARLTPEQLAALIAICWECSGAFQAPNAPRTQAVLVDRLASVVYECRSLERQISKHVIPLRGSAASASSRSMAGGSADGGGGRVGSGDGGREGGSCSGCGGGGFVVDTSEPSAEERARVDGVVHAADDPGYWFAASRDGNRESHYRGNALGATLIHELACFAGGAAAGPGGSGSAPGDRAYGSALPAIVRRFRARVDAALPGLYAWFDESSLHITVRALIP